jgi:error-prone DNA polymerase
VFVTLEDEHGFMNLVLWSKVFETYREIATGSRLLMVHGRLERSDDTPKDRAHAAAPLDSAAPLDPSAPQSVLHVIAERLEPLDGKLPAMGGMSRDFH